MEINIGDKITPGHYLMNLHERVLQTSGSLLENKLKLEYYKLELEIIKEMHVQGISFKVEER